MPRSDPFLLQPTPPARSAAYCWQMVCLAAVAFFFSRSVNAAEGKVDFNRDVRPILSNRCFKCHGPDENSRKGKLRLDDRASALAGGKSGEVGLVPGDPAQSEIIERLFTSDADELMPPPSAKMEMSDKERQILQSWVAQGGSYDPHPFFVSLQKQTPPVFSGVNHPIDAYVLKELQKHQLPPNPPASGAQLIRRVSLDLIGLPPTQEEIAAFLKDSSPDAYEKLVDRLLASPRYGERWARRWLDLARYADTNGYEKDRERQIWPWRDWVVHALNDDMPFDQFTVKQLAGDMLPDATEDDITATGFHRNSMLNEEGGNDPLEFRYHAMADRVATTGTTWLGLTLGCAQCHTHKYDPILHTEYFGLMAFLNNADDVNQDLPDPASETLEANRARQAADLLAALPNKWPLEKQPDAEWTTPPLASATSASDELPQIKPDHSALFSTQGSPKDTYELYFESTPKDVDRLRIEALADPAIPSGGPGRTGHGNFVLTELEVFSRPKGSNAAWAKLGFARASAEAQQPGFPVAAAIDGKADTGWAVQVGAGSHKMNRSAIFHFAKPLSGEDSEFKVVLAQQYGTHHTIGRVRVSLGKPLASPAQILTENQRRQKAFDSAFAQWLDKARQDTVPWSYLAPSTLKSNEPILTLESDSSVFVSGDTSKDDHFTLTFRNVPAGATALRLEALTDNRLPSFGPGRVYYEGTPGDFFLYDFTLTADGKEVAIATASSTLGDAKLAVDEDNLTGWTIKGGTGENQAAVFQLAAPLPAISTLTVEIKMGRYYASTLGKFRLSTTTSPVATTARVLPQGMEQILAKSEISGEERAELLRHFLLTTPQLAEAAKPVRELLKPIAPQRTLVLRERSEHHRTTRLHNRGEFTQPAQEVAPHVPAFLPPLATSSPSNRLGFAKWLVSRENPLTARVTVNRQWQAFFGTGLVKTLDDFGYQSETPSHPELLDWLAMAFMDNDWSMKKLHRLIVTSDTYQRDSRVTPESLAKDPQNRLLARGPRLRIEAEMIRDLALSAAGLLSPKLYGPPVRPPQPASVTEGAYGGMSWNVNGGEDRYRRGLYTFAKRSSPFASFQAFDAPTGEACVARREVSNTPLQSLVLLNDQVFFEAAQALGQRCADYSGSTQEKAAFAFQRCITREATPAEIDKLSAFYEQQLARINYGELKIAELMPPGASPEAAAWMTVARILLNLDETITKN